jgi:hypothetical protein
MKPYAPRWAGAHVTGQYSAMTRDESGIPEEQLVTASCSQCGATFRRKCSSGQPRSHIDRFAQVHLHRNVLKDPMPRKPA